MSNGKLLTLFLDYENELRATMPDFAHQLSELLNVPPKIVDYSKKAVAEYEVSETEPETTVNKESEEEFEFHEDFEKNIMFLMEKNDESMMSVFKDHFEGEENRETMMAQLADNFSLEKLQSFFEPAGYDAGYGTNRIDPNSKKNIEKKSKENNENKEKEKKRTFLDSLLKPIFGEEGMDVTPHCGVDPKKKKKNDLIEIKFCESCDAEHADHFRLCDLCNEEHDGCCEVYA